MLREIITPQTQDYMVKIPLEYLNTKVEILVLPFSENKEINSEDETSWDMIGYILEEQGELDEALVVYRKLLEINPKHEYAWHSMGCVLEKQGKLDEALNTYRNALKIEPKNELVPVTETTVFSLILLYTTESPITEY